MALRIAYHDACHLAHGQGVRQQPRDLFAVDTWPVDRTVCGKRDLLRQRRIFNLIQPRWQVRSGAARPITSRRPVLTRGHLDPDAPADPHGFSGRRPPAPDCPHRGDHRRLGPRRRTCGVPAPTLAPLTGFLASDVNVTVELGVEHEAPPSRTTRKTVIALRGWRGAVQLRKLMTAQIDIYDTTLRDGTQGERRHILGCRQIRMPSGWTHSRPLHRGRLAGLDPARHRVLALARHRTFRNARLAAFGSTRRKDVNVEQDDQVPSASRRDTPS